MPRFLPIGASDFKKVRDRGYYYVDKSLFIQEVLQNGSEVILLPRPRRFGTDSASQRLKWFEEGLEKLGQTDHDGQRTGWRCVPARDWMWPG